jgi:hypothetical protein
MLCSAAKIETVIWWCGELKYDILGGRTLISASAGSSRGRGTRAAGWFDDLITDKKDTNMKSLTLDEGIKGWATAGERYQKYMDGFDAGVWGK